MSNLGMGSSWYGYNTEEINSNVSPNKIGNYALGYEKEKGFIPKYVGRSDSDVQDELLNHLDDKKHHKKFMFSYASTKKEVYEQECKNFHDFEKQLENENHPDSPNGMNLKCPFQQYH